MTWVFSVKLHFMTHNFGGGVLAPLVFVLDVLTRVKQLDSWSKDFDWSLTMQEGSVHILVKANND